MDREESVEYFTTLLNERVRKNRKRSDAFLSHYTLELSNMINKHPELLNVLSKDINTILQDCEIYYNMPDVKAIDSMQELSNLASIFVNNPEHSDIYFRICKLIKYIRNSYPIKN